MHQYYNKTIPENSSKNHYLTSVFYPALYSSLSRQVAIIVNDPSRMIFRLCGHSYVQCHC